MKARPDNWDSMSLKEKEKFIMNQSTGVCNCTPAIGESCKECKGLIEEPKPKMYEYLVAYGDSRRLATDAVDLTTRHVKSPNYPPNEIEISNLVEKREAWQTPITIYAISLVAS